MNPIDRNFKGQLDDEMVICYFRRHWIKIFPSLALLVLCFLVLFVGFAYFSALGETSLAIRGLSLFASIVVTILIHHQFLVIFRYYLHTVILTNQRIIEIDKSAFFRDSKSSLDLSKIQDVQKRQVGVFQHLFNYGTLIITLSGSTEATIIELTPRPDYQFKKIHQVKSNYSFERAPRHLSAPEAQQQMPPIMVSTGYSGYSV